MGEDFLDRLKPAPTPQPARPVTPSTGSTAYGLAALAGEVDNLLSVPIGAGRNDQLNRSAVKMYGLVAAGELDEHAVTETLGAADGGLNYPATARTLQSARDAVFGRLGARNVEHVTHTKEVAPWERSDDPLDDGYAPPDAPHSAATTGKAPDLTSMQSAAVTGAEAGQPASADDARQAAYTQLIKAEAGKVRINREARRLIDHEDALRDFRVPPYLPTLTDELAIPDEPISYLVDKLIPTGANILLTAQYKTGKTTLVNNLARSLVDGVPFLGRYDVADLAGRVALFNYEVDGPQYRRWLRDVGIVHTDRVALLNLRGYRLPLLVPHVETWVVEWLKRAEASVWIVDPFARAATGTDENSNTEVGTFLDTLDVIKRRAGIGELVIPTHTGRADQEQGGERARGATRLNDWADVQWVYTKDKNNTRYLGAEGRDVLEDESALEFDPDTRHLTLTGGDRFTVDRDRYAEAVETIVKNRPGVGKVELRAGVRQILRTASDVKVDRAIEQLVAERRIHARREGKTVGHFGGPQPYQNDGET